MADPVTLDQIFTYGGMAIGAAVAAYVVHRARQQVPVPETDVMVTGQITNLKPITDLLQLVDLLVLQMTKAVVSLDQHTAQHARTAVALEELAVVMRAFVEATDARAENAEREAEIERRARERAEELLREQHPQPPSPDRR